MARAPRRCSLRAPRRAPVRRGSPRSRAARAATASPRVRPRRGRARPRSSSRSTAETAAARPAAARPRRAAARARGRWKDCRRSCPWRPPGGSGSSAVSRRSSARVSASVPARSGEPAGVQTCDRRARCVPAGTAGRCAQHEPPRQARQVDDARVREEFGEEAAHGLGRRRVRRAEIDDEDAGRGGHGRTIPEAPRARYEGGGRKKAAGRKPPGRRQSERSFSSSGARRRRDVSRRRRSGTRAPAPRALGEVVAAGDFERGLVAAVAEVGVDDVAFQLDLRDLAAQARTTR